MRTLVDLKLEFGRVRTGTWRSTASDGLAGAFFLMGPQGTELKIISSGSMDTVDCWEHVSVSCENRTPEWNEMCWVKDLFWKDDEVVVQYHPAKNDYVNYHPYCLHLWRPINVAIPVPPSHLVGPLK